MRIAPESFFFPDGQQLTLRSPEPEEAAIFLDFLKQTAGETEFLLRYPEECVKYTPEGEKALFDRMNAADNETMIVCLVDGVIAGNCQVTWKKSIKMRHRADVAIALKREFWGLGIGTRLFEEMIRIAEANENILQMELEFIEGNSRARALYEKMGFRITGMRPNAIRLKDGTLLNEYTMIRTVKR